MIADTPFDIHNSELQLFLVVAVAAIDDDGNSYCWTRARAPARGLPAEQW